MLTMQSFFLLATGALFSYFGALQMETGTGSKKEKGEQIGWKELGYRCTKEDKKVQTLVASVASRSMLTRLRLQLVKMPAPALAPALQTTFFCCNFFSSFHFLLYRGLFYSQKGRHEFFALPYLTIRVRLFNSLFQVSFNLCSTVGVQCCGASPILTGSGSGSRLQLWITTFCNTSLSKKCSFEN